MRKYVANLIKIRQKFQIFAICNISERGGEIFLQKTGEKVSPPRELFVLLSADMADMESQILQGLNPAQRDAVVNYDYPSLIIAGAGSGKTRVLTSRIAYMIEQRVAPQSIITMTFTKKAANEMRNRIQKMIPDILTESQASSLWMGTFHSVCARILRLNAERIGYPTSFTIYEPTDVKNLLKKG